MFYDLSPLPAHGQFRSPTDVVQDQHQDLDHYLDVADLKIDTLDSAFGLAPLCFQPFEPTLDNLTNYCHFYCI